jgi:hypothetical protein
MTTLHDDLAKIAAAQPVQPVDRLGEVTGRARAIRRRRVARSGIAAVVLVSAGLGLVSATKPQSQPLTASPVTSWPDRSQPAAVRLGAGGERDMRANGVPVLNVHYVYRGLVDLPNHAQHVVCVFTAAVNGVPSLVTMSAAREDLTADGARRSPDIQGWITDITPLTDGVVSHVGLAVRSTAGTTTLVSIDPPAARRLDWRQLPLPHSEVAVPQPDRLSGTATSGDGVFVTDLPGLVGPVRVRVSAGSRRLPEQPLTSQVAELVPPAPPAYRETPQDLGGGGPGTTFPDASRPGRWDVSAVGYEAFNGRRISVYVRCYGGGQQRYVLKSHSDDRLLAGGSVTCDGVTGRALAFTGLPKTGFVFSGYGDRLQAYQYRFVLTP